MPHEPFDETVALFAIDALAPEERQTFEAHLRMGCEECRAALKEYRAAAGLLPLALEPMEAPFHLKSHLMRTFALDKGTSQPSVTTPRVTMPPQPPWWRRAERSPHMGSRFLLAASIVLLIGVALYAVKLWQQLQTEETQRHQLESALQGEISRLSTLQEQTNDQENKLVMLRKELADKLGVTRDTLVEREAELDQLRARLAQREKDVTALTASLGKRDEIAAFMRSPNTRVVALSGTEEAQAAGALLLVDPATQKALLFVFNMPHPPEGKTYQLWAILDKPVSAGTFETDSGNKSRVMIRRVPDLSHVKKFAVSLEPAGGQPQPTGPMYLYSAQL